MRLASSFVQFSPYRKRIQNFLGDTFGGTVYPDDILRRGYMILCAEIQKTGDAKYPMTPGTVPPEFTRAEAEEEAEEEAGEEKARDTPTSKQMGICCYSIVVEVCFKKNGW